MSQRSKSPGPEIRVIVNADDLGYDETINDAVFRGIERGMVTSASLMAIGNAVEEAVERIPGFPGASFGIHLSLTEFEPLTGSGKLAFLRGPDGAFAGRRDDLCRHGILVDTGVKDALFDELMAQVEKVRSLGVEISHLDSHHHVHTIGALLPVFKRVLRETGIRCVRRPMNLFDQDRHSAGAARRIKNRLISQFMRRGPPAATTDCFTAFGTFLSPVAHAAVGPGSSVELMVHPGHPLCDEENALLESDWESRLPFSVRRITYNDL